MAIYVISLLSFGIYRARNFIKSIYSFKDEKNKEIIHKLENYGLKMEIEDTQSSSLLENMTFVVTGTLPTLSRKKQLL